MQEIEDHLADRESAIAEAKADRHALINSDRPSWRNSLNDLLEWQERHGVTAEEITSKELTSIALAKVLRDAGAGKWLNSHCELDVFEFIPNRAFFLSGTHWMTIRFTGIESVVVESVLKSTANPTPETLKSFFSNE